MKYIGKLYDTTLENAANGRKQNRKMSGKEVKKWGKF